MKDVTATEAARRFSDLLDAVEHRNESFVVVRKGRPVAHITRAAGANGKILKAILKRFPRDKRWRQDLEEMRSLVELGETRWND